MVGWVEREVTVHGCAVRRSRWNYGMVPQTWEDPAYNSSEAGGVIVSASRPTQRHPAPALPCAASPGIPPTPLTLTLTPTLTPRPKSICPSR